jgi:hypothetical protein
MVDNLFLVFTECLSLTDWIQLWIEFGHFKWCILWNKMSMSFSIFQFQPRALRMTTTEEPYLHLKTILAALFCAICSLLIFSYPSDHACCFNILFLHRLVIWDDHYKQLSSCTPSSLFSASSSMPVCTVRYQPWAYQHCFSPPLLQITGRYSRSSAQPRS